MPGIKDHKLALSLFLLGACVVVGGVLWPFQSLAFAVGAETTTGQITKIYERVDSEGDPEYCYDVFFRTLEGKSVTIKTNVCQSGRPQRIDSNVSVLYYSNNPEGGRIDSFLELYFLPLMLILLPMPFLCVSMIPLISLFLGKYYERKRYWYQHNGCPIETTYAGVEVNHSLWEAGIQLNEPRAYKIVTEWYDPDAGIVRTFKSRNIWYNPESLIENDMVTVYLDPKNSAKYFMEVPASKKTNQV